MKSKILLVKDDPKMRKRNGYFGIVGLACTVIVLAFFIAGCAKEGPIDPSSANTLSAASISETIPADQADTVATNPVVAVTFKSATTPSEVSASTITLMQGTTPVSGTLTFSGNTATFTPTADLAPNAWFTATIKTNHLKSSDGDQSGSKEHSWKFKTGDHHHNKALSVVSVVPALSATAVAVTIQPSVTFSEETKSSTVNTTTFTLTQGTTVVAGTVTSDDKKATFKPTVALTANTVYTGTITTGVKDESGNTLASNYTWSFTTAGNGVDVAAPVISSVLPANNATTIAVTSKPSVVFSEAMNPATITSTTFTLKQGATVVAGTVAYSGTTATFTPTAALTANLIYTGTITTGAKDVAGNALAANYTWSFTTGTATADVIAPTVASVVPANNGTAIAITSKPAVTFSEAMNPATLTSTTFTLKQGATVVAGTVAYSGTTATFTPTAALAGNLVFTGTITTGAKDVAGNALAANYTWSFTTAASTPTDVTPPTVLSAVPANSATGVAVTSKPVVTFSEAMNASTITAATFTLKQGATAVAGAVSYSGTAATFTPSSALVANTVYTGSITTGAKDAAGNAIAAYTWSFTTAVAVVVDATPPTVQTIVPASGATAIATSSKVTATFSEAMNASTITSSTFTVKQGTTAVAGAVSYSGTSATFTPSAALTGGLVYTATITTGATDAAGNAIASSYSWNFTTVATAVLTSFATQISPIVTGKCMPCHGATSPSAGISLTNYAQIKAIGSSLDNPGMYSKMGVTAAEQALIQSWILQGSLNN